MLDKSTEGTTSFSKSSYCIIILFLGCHIELTINSFHTVKISLERTSKPVMIRHSVFTTL